MESLIKFTDSKGRLKQVHTHAHGSLKPLVHGHSQGVSSDEAGSAYTQRFPRLSDKAGDGQPRKP